MPAFRLMPLLGRLGGALKLSTGATGAVRILLLSSAPWFSTLWFNGIFCAGGWLFGKFKSKLRISWFLLLFFDTPNESNVLVGAEDSTFTPPKKSKGSDNLLLVLLFVVGASILEGTSKSKISALGFIVGLAVGNYYFLLAVFFSGGFTSFNDKLLKLFLGYSYLLSLLSIILLRFSLLGPSAERSELFLCSEFITLSPKLSPELWLPPEALKESEL